MPVSECYRHPMRTIAETPENRHGTNRSWIGFSSMARERLLPLPGSPEAREEGCTCPEPKPGQGGRDYPFDLDRNCPVHGLAAAGAARAAEKGAIDKEGDIADAAVEPELRKDWPRE